MSWRHTVVIPCSKENIGKRSVPCNADTQWRWKNKRNPGFWAFRFILNVWPHLPGQKWPQVKELCSWHDGAVLIFWYLGQIFAEESQPIINRALFVSVWETHSPKSDKCYKHLKFMKFPIHDGLTLKRHSDWRAKSLYANSRACKLGGKMQDRTRSLACFQGKCNDERTSVCLDGHTGCAI